MRRSELRQVDIGCWGDFRRKYGLRVAEWAEEQARQKGIKLEEDTEVFYDFHDRENAVIYFGGDAVKETIECAMELGKRWLKRKCGARKNECNGAQMEFYWANQA
jgi:hypothetical protein